MSIERAVERIIREAMEEGEFDQLEGKGRPVNLDAYFATPEELRAGFSLMKNAGVIPEEMELLKEINSLRSELNACETEAERAELKKSLNEKMLKYNLLVERHRR